MRKILKILLIVCLIALAFIGGWLVHKNFSNIETNSIPAPLVEKLRPLEKYSFENLTSADIKEGVFKIKDELEKKDKYTSYLFEFEFDPGLNGEKKKTSGLINIPQGEGKFPLIVMFRGYVDQKIYQTGVGTKRSAEVFASNNYITVAPDFLGYASSDPEAANIFESRFQTYVTAIALLNSVNQIDKFDKTNIAIWGHSNGGQIALTTLEITGRNIPTVLWAPVSKPFPYSILYYTDESDDRGKLIRHELSKFEDDYDVEKYSLTNYLEKITAPLEIHQGTADDAVPKEWTDSLFKNLKNTDKEVGYFVYPGADHNLQPSWNTVVARNLEFFRKHFSTNIDSGY